MLISSGWADRSRELGRLPFFTAGLACGVSLSMAVVWVLSASLQASVGVGLFVLVNLVALADVATDGKVPHVPRRVRMIPDTRFDRSLRRGAFSFGVELGSGVMAIALYASVYALLLAPLATRDLLVLAPATAGWAIGRSLPLVSRMVHRDVPAAHWRYCWPHAGVGRAVQTLAWAVAMVAAIIEATSRLGG